MHTGTRIKVTFLSLLFTKTNHQDDYRKVLITYVSNQNENKYMWFFFFLSIDLFIQSLKQPASNKNEILRNCRKTWLHTGLYIEIARKGRTRTTMSPVLVYVFATFFRKMFPLETQCQQQSHDLVILNDEVKIIMNHFQVIFEIGEIAQPFLPDISAAFKILAAVSANWNVRRYLV